MNYITVKTSTTFYELHHILQIAFSWENSHLYQFKVEDYFIGSLDPEYDIAEMKVIDAKTVILGKIMTEEAYE